MNPCKVAIAKKNPSFKMSALQRAANFKHFLIKDAFSAKYPKRWIMTKVQNDLHYNVCKSEIQVLWVRKTVSQDCNS